MALFKKSRTLVEGPFPAQGHPHLVSDLIPEHHQHLPMLRVFLPVCREIDELARWSDFVSLNDESASLEWSDVVERVREYRPRIQEFAPATGELDVDTQVALVEAIGSINLSSLRWMGYPEAPRMGRPVRVFGDDYYPSALEPSDLEIGRRIPEFAWDASGRIAWGSRLYGDSFVVAAEPEVAQRLHRDPRIDTVPVRVNFDVMPRSAGD